MSTSLRFFTCNLLGDNNLSYFSGGNTFSGPTALIQDLSFNAAAHGNLTFPMLAQLVFDDTGEEINVMVEAHPAEGGRFIALIISLGDE